MTALKNSESHFHNKYNIVYCNVVRTYKKKLFWFVRRSDKLLVTFFSGKVVFGLVNVGSLSLKLKGQCT